MAKQAGATKDEVISSVVMNLRPAGLVSALEGLSPALEGWEKSQ